MKIIAVLPLFALLIVAGKANACDKLAPNCTPANVAIDSAQKGPVAGDPLSDGLGSRERNVRLPANG